MSAFCNRVIKRRSLGASGLANMKFHEVIILLIIALHLPAGYGQSCTEGAVRLQSSSFRQREGTVLVCINEVWGTICSIGSWDSRDAAVVCSQLGFPSLGAIPHQYARYGRGSGPVWLDNVRCLGNETRLLNCTHNGIAVISSYCSHIYDVGVQCLGVVAAQCSDGDIRLVGGAVPYEGRVEICHQNSWGTICDNGWSSADATVVCRQLNFTSFGAAHYLYSFYGRGSGGIYLDRVSCSGNEQALINCSHRGIGVHSCTHSEDAGVMCLGPPDNCINGEIRLISGQSDLEGTVQICVFGYWGTICDSSWDSRDAYVVCKQLGYPAIGSIPLRNAPFGRGVGPIWLDNLYCLGNESSLLNCSHRGLSVIATYCDHSDDVGVQCVVNNLDDCSQGQLRLIGGSSENEGRVEICYDNQWGTICDNGWSSEDAKVVCRQLGFQTAGAVHFRYGSSYFGQGSGGIFLQNLACSGDELMLINCSHSGIGVHSCSHSEDAGVVCLGDSTDNCTEGQLRLFPRSSSNRMEGVVQICAHGYWGTICNHFNSWDSRSADVVCNQLGYATHGAIPLRRWISSLSFRFPIWLDSVQCIGNESSLLNCTHSAIGDIGTFCDHYDDVGVTCWEPVKSATPCTNGTVRLVGGSTSYEGRVEICYRNQWGTVCDDSWSTTDAQVVCRQLGLTTTGALAYTNAYFGRGYGGIFLDNVACSGTESRLMDCISSSRIGVHNCRHYDDAGVKCGGTPMLNCTHGDVRLESGRNDREGTLRVCIGGMWSTVCNSGWDSQDAAVVCRQLGFPVSAAIPLLTTRSGRGTGTALVNNFACTGQELSLLSCTHILLASSCSYFYFVGVQCLDPVNATTPCYDGELRLAGGTVANEGRVEVCYQNQWGTVCRDGWSTTDARVACRQLGYSELGAVVKTFEGGDGAIFLESLACSGGESTLIECSHPPINVHNCDHSNDAGVLCNLPEGCTDGDVVLLFGPNSSEGTVEVCVSGYWSTVCRTNWDSREAGIVCRQLGLPSLGAIPVVSARNIYGSNTDRPIILNGFGCTGSERNLLSCPRYSISSVTCSHSSDVGVQCLEIVNASCATGDVRLADGHRDNRGRVEICYQSQWGTVCDDGWSSTDARVVCNQLGYSPFGATVLSRGQYHEGSGPIFLDNVGCRGTESSLLECYHPGIGVHNCQHDDDVGIECLSQGNCTHGEVHLLFGSNEREGTVEVCVHGYWGTICDNGWDSRDAGVICRQLGYSSFGALPYLNSFFGRSSGPILLDYVSCNLFESNITNCIHNGFGITSPYCDHSDDAGVQCLRVNSTEPCTTGSIRLVDGAINGTLATGRVEICYQNIWGTVCDDSWRDADARVVCRILGYPPLGAVAYTNSRFGNGVGVIFLDNVACRGNETSLLNCSHAGIGVHNCDHTDDAGVACYSTASTNCTEGDVRLTGSRKSDPREGTVEICVNGYWGTICSNGWDRRDARVICSTLGFPSLGAIPYQYSYFGYGTGPVILDSVNCIGNESRITQCAHLGVGVTASYCYHYSDVGVVCQVSDNCTDGTIRLVGGLSARDGRVEICVEGNWGTVCDDSWNDLDAQVVCRQLGYSPLGAIAHSNAFFGAGSGQIWLDDVLCSGTESNLLECAIANSEIGIHNCGHHEDAGVECTSSSNCTQGDIRLLFGSNAREGTVEVCVSGYWSSICDTFWDSRNADVVCRRAGFATIGAVPYTNAFFGPARGPLLIDNVQCRGSEDNILNCSRHPIGVLQSYCDHNDDVGVQCPVLVNATPPCSDGDLRLVNGSSANEGRVEICYQNRWGTTCDDNWDVLEARVVCSQLGYPSLGAVVLHSSVVGSGSGPIFLDNVGCTGSESSLLDCVHNGIGVHNCRHTDDVGVKCRVPDNCTLGDIHLLYGSNDREGTVEICVNGYWSTVCHSSWDSRDAAVVCRQLGFTHILGGAISHRSSFFGRGNGVVLLNSIRCDGTETRLIDCTAGSSVPSYCSLHYYDAGVTCVEPSNSTMCTDGAIRLVGGVTRREGRVEICLQNQWGTVCDNGWGGSDSRVACRQLGFDAIGASPYGNSRPYGAGSGPIFLQNLRCVGSEANLLSCGHSGIGVHSCSHHEDAGVNCSVPSNCTNGDIRLRNGLNAREGNVEVCVDGFWGTVCSNYWDSREATVVCKQLGFVNSAAIPLRYSRFGVGSGPILLDYLQCTGRESNLLECSRSNTQISCNHYSDAGVECADHINATIPCADGDLRLVGGMNESEGRVEICISNQWGTVCRNSWSVSDAKVVCRQLGFSALGAVALTYTTTAYFGRGSGGIFLDRVNCDGTESSLISCSSSGVGVHTCDHSQDAGVRCQASMNCSEGNVRLRFGANETIGTVEVCADGFWGTICYNLWDSRDADVVCRQLGFQTFGAIPYFNSYFGSTGGPIILDRVTCSRQEANILECLHGGIGVVLSSCNRYNQVGVQCLDPVNATSCTNGAVRLVGGSNSSEGRVEICYQNQWGTVCDNSWSYNDAQVVCSQLGYPRHSAIAYSNARFGQGSGGIFLSNVLCTGTESSLFDCPHAGIGVHSCRHLDDAGVSCSQSDNCTEGDIRLRFGPQANQGTVEVCISSFWSSICGNSWDSRDAQVVCRQLGYSTLGAAPRYLSYYGRLSGPVLLDSLGCIGNEANILQCLHRGIGMVNSFCDYHYYDAGVDCPVNTNTTCVTGDIRLVNGFTEREGRVEVCYQNQWGTVCDQGWGSGDARVVCRQLGFEPLGGIPHGSAFYGSGTGGIFLTSVPCRGREQFLLNCTNQPISVSHTCTHSRDAGVNCTSVRNCTHGSTQLVHGSTAREGTVEICVDGIWGSVCDNGWDSRDAQVVCHQLGFVIFGPIPVYNSYFGKTTNPILIDFSSCVGNETNLVNCTHNNAVLSSSCDNNDEAGVICTVSEYSNCTNGDVRLIGSAENEGRVEVCYHNQWGTVCDNGWNDFDARVVCSQLGYARLGGVSVTNAFFGQGSGGIFLNNIRCSGNEDALINCSHSGIGVHTCTHRDDAGVQCLRPDNCIQGSVRLRSGQTGRRGTVEVCVDGYWGTICHYGWDSRDADVVCRQLGFNTFGAIPRRYSHLGRGSGPVVLNLVSCNGNESNILNCRHSTIFSICSTYNLDSGVECVEPVNATIQCMDGDIRLIGGLNQGRIEVCYSNQWGSVCDNSWDDRDARVVCRQLGFPPFGGTAFRLTFDSAPGAFFLDDLHCLGNETTLLNCTHNGIAVHTCTSSEIAGVVCQVPSNCSSGNIRLSQGSQGTVEICVDGYWGTICDNQWDSIDASVACQQLGYSYLGSIGFRQTRFGQLSRPILLDRVSCRGNEQGLLNCTHSGHGIVSPFCSTNTLAGVQCSHGNTSCHNDQVRLVNGATANEGRVELCYQNQWGTVCDDNWSNIDAQVVCRQLGYSVIGATAFRQSYFGSGTGGILLDNVDCSGQEQYLVDCRHSPIGVHNCDHSKDAGVFCIPPLYKSTAAANIISPSISVPKSADSLSPPSVGLESSSASSSMKTMAVTIPPPTSPAPGESAAFFELRLQPISDCLTWTESLQEEKLNSIIDEVYDAIESLCSCNLPENTIDKAVFSCRNTNKAVVFKAHLSIADKLMSANQILHLIKKWVETSPSIIVTRTLLKVDPTCPTELETLLADDCQKPIIHSNTSVATPPGPDTEKQGDNNSSGIVSIITGTAVGLLVLLTLVLIIVIGCVVLYKAKFKRDKTHDNWYPLQHNFELSDCPSVDRGVSVASNPLDDGDSIKYELPPNVSFSVSNPVYQDDKPSSDMLKGSDSRDDAFTEAGDISHHSTSS